MFDHSSPMEITELPDPTLHSVHQAVADIKAILKASTAEEAELTHMDERLSRLDQTLSDASSVVAQLQSLSMANKALDGRINRAVSPALRLLHCFRRAESFQRRLFALSSSLSSTKAASSPERRLRLLLRYVDTVDQLNAAVDEVGRECDPAVKKLQEVVGFLSRTKATDQFKIHRLTETMVALKALYETEVDAMKYEGELDEALMSLQDEYEKLLLQIIDSNIGNQAGQERTDEESKENPDQQQLGTDLQIEVLKKISDILAKNDCADICIDIFVKVRYKRAAKALMRLSPDYLRIYDPEDIDEMEWESLETAITLWTQHLGLAVTKVLASEKQLCSQVLSGLLEGQIWLECFIKIADKIMAVFFRFGEGVARSCSEPQKLFKLLDMYHQLEKMKPVFVEVFEGEAGSDIRSRFRELEKLLIHGSCKVFWEMGLQIEGNQDGIPPPNDGSVPKLIRYAVNYLRYLATDQYRDVMAAVLNTEQTWKMAGSVDVDPINEADQNNNQFVLRDAIANIMEAMQRNVEIKKSRYRDNVLPHVFSMNTNWYIYMRSRNSELVKVLGEPWLKTHFKAMAEESAYYYRKSVWGPVVKHLEVEPAIDSTGSTPRLNKPPSLSNPRKYDSKLDAFIRGVEDNTQKHRNGSYKIPDVDLKVQIKEAAVKFVVPAYTSFLESCSGGMVQITKAWPKVEMIKEMVRETYEDVASNQSTDGKAGRRRMYTGSHGGGRVSKTPSIDGSGSYDVNLI